jgi:mRNA-decapping enzyme subunit 2
MYNNEKIIISENVINDLYVRFLSYLPVSILTDNNNLLCHIQEAYWFYLDYIMPLRENSDVNSVSFLSFVTCFCRFFGWRRRDVKDYVKSFWVYCSEVPRCGGILLNDRRNKVLLVRNIGSKYWDFPVGKKMDQEDFMECAEREVFEETGFHGQCSCDMISYKSRKSIHRLFVFYNVPEEYDFTPQTRNEIEDIKWCDIDELPKILNPNVFFGDFFQFLLTRIQSRNYMSDMSYSSFWMESDGQNFKSLETSTGYEYYLFRPIRSVLENSSNLCCI